MTTKSLFRTSPRDDIDVLWRIQGLAWRVSREFGDEFSDVFHNFYHGKSMQVTRVFMAEDRERLLDFAMLCDALLVPAIGGH